jgi:hypothetical protein
MWAPPMSVATVSISSTWNYQCLPIGIFYGLWTGAHIPLTIEIEATTVCGHAKGCATPAHGPSPALCNVRFCAAVWGQADIADLWVLALVWPGCHRPFMCD